MKINSEDAIQHTCTFMGRARAGIATSILMDMKIPFAVNSLEDDRWALTVDTSDKDALQRLQSVSQDLDIHLKNGGLPD